MDIKDYFSDQSKVYATFRPTYPDELYQFIFRFLKNKKEAWDCGTGNGQVATYLSRHFESVFATDISEKQLSQAPQVSNISYTVCPAEKTSFEDGQFDLITVAQALHWFDRDSFFSEVKRLLKPHGIIAVWGYNNLSVSPEIDKLFLDFYNNTIGSYWDNARRLVENEYIDITFPFMEIKAPRFYIKLEWTRPAFAGYLQSWSATQKFIKANQQDPVPAFIDSLDKLWKPDDAKTVTFPVFLRLGKI